MGSEGDPAWQHGVPLSLRVGADQPCKKIFSPRWVVVPYLVAVHQTCILTNKPVYRKKQSSLFALYTAAMLHNSWSTGIRGLMTGMATLHKVTRSY